MSIEFKLSNETLAEYARSSDALEALRLTVGNGQSRLALEVLLEITDQLCAKVSELELNLNKLLLTNAVGKEASVKKQQNVQVTENQEADSKSKV